MEPLRRGGTISIVRRSGGGHHVGGRVLRSVCATIAAFVMAVIPPGVALATAPGRNGPVVFSSYGEIYTVRPDGTGLTHVVRSAMDQNTEFEPSWSPDGERIVAMGQVYDTGTFYWSRPNPQLFAPDGTNFVRLSTPWCSVGCYPARHRRREPHPHVAQYHEPRSTTSLRRSGFLYGESLASELTSDATNSLQLVGAGGYAASLRRAPAEADLVPTAVPRTLDRSPAHEPQTTEAPPEQGFRPMELGGLEPPTSWVRSRRSPN